MKILNRESAKEIGFDIDCLPAWVNYIARDKIPSIYHSYWFGFHDLPELDDEGDWTCFDEYVTVEIPEYYAPTKFDGDFEDSLFKIQRK